MSRRSRMIANHIEVSMGFDHALGQFIQITDSRYAGTEDDYQGEGYVFEWDESFGITTNLINLTVEEMNDNDAIASKCNAFASQYVGQPKPNW